ncbi:MAG: hypothetical protein ACOY0R_14465 [Chloroflexota bacterium]
MPITYTNRKGFTYFLNKGVTKTGKPRYYFAREQKDEPVEEIPAGYEIDESVNAIVSLVKARPQLIHPGESASVKSALKRHPRAGNYRVAIKSDQVIIYEGIGVGMDSLRSLLGLAGLNMEGAEEGLQAALDRHTQFTPVMRFVLDDQETRAYHADCWRHGGGIDDWVYAGHSGNIKSLAAKLIPTLGTDAFYGLY